jgi:predicted metal-dependent enzyme (double-stranded beta helix superfamily)
MATQAQLRKFEIAKSVRHIREISNQQGITPDSLLKIRDTLVTLGLQKEFFTEEDFPLPEPDPDTGKPARNILYLLSQDRDQQFALYLSTENPGMDRTNKPHNHTAWAAIAGVLGNELNILYNRTDDSKTPGKGTVEKSHEFMVEPGTGVALMPEDVHSLYLNGEPTMTLHMYGTAMENMTSRVSFNEDGNTEIRPVNPNIIDKR